MKNRVRLIIDLLGILAILTAAACNLLKTAAREANAQPNPIKQDGGQLSQDQQQPVGNPPADVPVSGASAPADTNPPAASPAVPSGTGNLTRTYTFPDTNKQIPYRIYVPTSWNAGQKLPLVVILHDRREDENTYFDTLAKE